MNADKVAKIAREAILIAAALSNSEKTSEDLKILSARLDTALLERPTGEAAGQYMENFVNIMSNREENRKFVEWVVRRTHRTLNQSLIGLFAEVMKEEAKLYEEDRYDLRNEAAATFCHKIVDTIDATYFPLI